MRMLDTDACSYAMKRTHPEVIARLRRHAVGTLKVSAVTIFELEYGARRSDRYLRLATVIRAFLDNVEVLPVDFAASREASAIRAELAANGTPIGACDLLIAGHARAAGATLVTHNTREFGRVRDLALEDWVG